MKHRQMAKKFRVVLVALLAVVMIPVTATTAYAEHGGPHDGPPPGATVGQPVQQPVQHCEVK